MKGKPVGGWSANKKLTFSSDGFLIARDSGTMAEYLGPRGREEREFMESELMFRIVLEKPPAPGVDFGLQKGRSNDQTIRTRWL
jgi:hypothetical protein